MSKAALSKTGQRPSATMSRKDQIRAQAEGSLEAFIRLVHPRRVLGNIHIDVINWWTREEARNYQLLLLPRDHGKSAMVAYRVAWEITRNPAIRVLYISSTANLAEKQLKFIKDILTSDVYRFYWPDMINPEEGKRSKWTNSEIEVDHPLRRLEAVRDPTVFTAGLTTSITGLHCDIAVLDDIVVKENAYTEEGRNRVIEQYSLLSSIEGADAREWIVGTRYHPNDLYQTLMERQVEIFNEEGEILRYEQLYEKKEHTVENRGDGTGEFLWPRQQGSEGKWFGFDIKILADKRAKYLDQVQYRAQYYNDPNDPNGAGIDRSYFQYYDRNQLSRRDGKWHIKGRRLNVFAAVDFAFSLAKRADYTTIAVIGIDSDRNYYILDIDRFKTGMISEYFEHILQLHRKWDFRKLRAEVTSAQQVIVNDLKQNYIRPYGLALSIEEFRPTRNEGSKNERVLACLQPKYHNLQIWHYMDGNCQVLEEELMLSNPPHDDVKDAVASAIDVAVPPSSISGGTTSFRPQAGHARFGGYG